MLLVILEKKSENDGKKNDVVDKSFSNGGLI